MWQWLTINSVWIFTISAFVLILLYFVRQWARSRLQKVMSRELYERMRKSGNIVFWAIEGLAFVMIAIALVAVVLSREGAAALITTETIQKWFLQHGVPIMAMLLVGAFMWFALNKFLPHWCSVPWLNPSEVKACRE